MEGERTMYVFRGVTAVVLLALNTLFGVATLLPVALVKLALPVDAVRKRVDRLLNIIAARWIANNAFVHRDARFEVRGAEGLSASRWYLVVANHQTWADIFVLQRVFGGRIPFLKFFLKQELIWVPLIGLAWWALDFPFMKRHSAEFLRQHPERRGDDLKAIRRACEKFSLIPTAVMTFPEGTRFTREKQSAEGASYRHLLSPRAGGIGLALNAMGERFQSLLDVTIFYPGGAPSFFEMLGGRMKEVVVDVRERPIPAELAGGNYAADPSYRERVQQWVGEMWREKDELLETLHYS